MQKNVDIPILLLYNMIMKGGDNVKDYSKDKKTVNVQLDREYDADIIEYLSKQRSMTRTIREALRLKMKKDKEVK